MTSFLNHWFSPPVFGGDEIKTQRARLLHALLITFLVYLSLLVPLYWLSDQSQIRVVLVDLAAYALILVLVFLLRRGEVSLAGMGAIGLAYTSFTLAGASQGTIRTPTTASYLLVVILAGVLFDRRGILLSMIASSLAVLGLILAENAGLLPDPDYSVSLVQWFTYTSLFVITGGLSYYHSQTIQRALRRARDEIAERKRAEEMQRQSEANFRFLLNNIGDVIARFDRHGTLLFTSETMRSFGGYEPDEILNTSGLERIHPDDSLQVQGQMLTLVETGIDQRAEYRMQHKDGSYFWVEGTARRVFNPAGEPEIVLVQRDINARKRSQALLHLRLELLECAADQSMQGFMQAALDRIGKFLDSPAGFYHLVDPDQQTLTLQAWSTRTLEEFCQVQFDSPESRHYPLDQAGVWVDCVRQGRPVIHNDYPALPHRKGLPPGHAAVRRLLSAPVMREGRAVAILGVGNKPGGYTAEDVEAVAYLADVTWEIIRRKQVEDALWVKTKEMETFFNTALDLLCIADTDGNFLRVNQEWANVLGYPLHELEGRRFLDFVHPDDMAPTLAAISELSGQNSILNFTNRYRCQDGSYRWIEWRSIPAGKRIYAAARDITNRKLDEAALNKANQALQHHVEEIEQLQAELREQALHDPLTDLYNRRYLSEALEREIARAGRGHTPVSIIVSDIDHFKRINDTYGHQVGDQFLIQVAELFKRSTRGSDFVCRYGGEEFLLVLPAASSEAAGKRAEEIRQKCAELIVRHDGKDLMITMSLGIAAYPEHGQDAEEIIIKADTALYHSKNSGRNRVSIWDPSG